MEYPKSYTVLLIVLMASANVATFANEELTKTNKQSAGFLTEMIKSFSGRLVFFVCVSLHREFYHVRKKGTVFIN